MIDRVPITDGDLKAIYARTKAVVNWGRIDYSDAFGSERFTEFVNIVDRDADLPWVAHPAPMVNRTT
jgi:hypothetical protein